jgi:hypothetical protein
MAKLKADKIIKVINKGIAVNPTEITFTQTIRKEVDGAFEEEIINRTITVLIYTEEAGFSNVNTESKIQGTSYISSRYKMIADSNADLDVTPTQAIKFTSNGDKFEIKAVYPIIIEDMVCGYQVDLERID